MDLWCVVKSGRMCNCSGQEVHGHGVGIQVWSCDVLHKVEKCATVMVPKFLIIVIWRFVSWFEKISMSYRIHAIVPMMTCGVE